MSHVRQCSRQNCHEPAVATMTYGYDDATAVIGPLSPVAEPGAFDLCADHALSVTVPRGWTMVRLMTEFEPAPPSDSDLMALADAIRETSRREVPPPVRARREVSRPADISADPVPRARLSLVPEADSADEAEQEG
ncbi:DUF3499 domain-containing protein [Actinobaculum sp. 352]|uniref:DUF3499 domain-containing protein n=2 Tax=unclassified Actinobaculum TaxID=2609299 RepID=UPI000D528D08|nr:DUF3499 domain-containing protein [Actinobaculum sp. 352]AWE41964.1 DUF3499 domain-containing protein [Actinobaculum sp. 313]RTE50121.1 DUF3499 domain-containing protein [Actinobaculum sp. 352]